MNTEVTDTEPKLDTPLTKSTSQGFAVWVVVSLIILAGVAAAFVIYFHDGAKIKSLDSENNALNTQTASLKIQVQQQNNINNGVVAPGSIYKDPAGGIGLVNGAVTFTLPSNWKRVPHESCAGGTIDSTAVCQDVASIAPGNMVESDGTSKWSATIGVYDYASTDGSARNWFESVYYHSPLADLGNPEAANISQSPVNGYSALSFDYVATNPAPTPPDYTDAFFTVVHGSYAVVVSAQVQASTAYGNANAFDYTSTYLPELTKMVQSIKFQ
jgi:hypothetical protein